MFRRKVSKGLRLHVVAVATANVWFFAAFFGSGVVGQQPVNEDLSEVIRVPAAVVKIADSVAVPAEYAGVLTELSVREGQILKVGDPIAKLKDEELRMRLERADYEDQIARLKAANDIDIRFAKKSNEVAESDLSRSYRSNAKVANAVSIGKLERQVLERDRTVLQREQAVRDFEVEKLKAKVTGNEVALSKMLMEKTEIRAPIDGMVMSIERRQGEWVEPSETVVRLIRVDRLRVEGFVPVADAVKIKIGTPVQVKFSQAWLVEQEFSGNIVFVSPEANPVNSQVLVWAEIKDPEKNLVAGLRGEIFVQLPNSKKTDLQIGRRE